MWNERSLAEGIEDVKRVGSLGDQKKLPNIPPPPDFAPPREDDEDPNRLFEGEEEEDESCRRLMRLWREPITYRSSSKSAVCVRQYRTKARSQRGPGKRKTHFLKLVLSFLEIEMRADGRVLAGKGGVFLRSEDRTGGQRDVEKRGEGSQCDKTYQEVGSQTRVDAAQELQGHERKRGEGLVNQSENRETRWTWNGRCRRRGRGARRLEGKDGRSAGGQEQRKVIRSATD